MQKQTYQWRLFNMTTEPVERYCSHCGSKVTFTDSGKRRVNANGKNLYEYAIYKCERDHTWNKTLKMNEGSTEFAVYQESILGCSNENIELLHFIEEGMDEIEIFLEEVIGKWRLDKLLGEKIPDTSRNVICKMIDNGAIRVDGRTVRQNMRLKKHQVITIFPKAFKTEPEV
ncbi:MAG: hypothetical protein GX115_12685 [Ruminiclostridium sp.]|nr:hypothetical protein [Ruminiclostridium sp.]